MKLRPTILHEYTKDKGVKAALAAAAGAGGAACNFCSPDDGCVLEDEGARMKMKGEALPVDELVTGGRRML